MGKPEGNDIHEKLIQKLPDGVFVIQEGFIVFANRIFASLLGRDIDQIIGVHWAGYVHPDQQDEILKVQQRHLDGDESMPYAEVTFVHGDGTTLAIEINAHVIQWKGKPAQLAVARDITRQNQAQDMLFRERNALRIIGKAAVSATSVVDLCHRALAGLTDNLKLKNGSVFILENKTGTLKPAAVLGDLPGALKDLFPPMPVNDQNYVPSIVAKTRQPIYAPDIENHEIYSQARDRLKIINIRSMISWPLVSSGNELLGVLELWSENPQTIAESDRIFFETVTQLLGSALETFISREKQAESEERFRTFFNASKDAIVAVDETGIVNLFNEAASRMFNVPADQILGKELYRIMPPSLREVHGEYLKNYFEKKFTGNSTPKPVESVGIKSDGSTFPVEITLSEGVSEGKRFLIALIRDVSDRKKAEDKLYAERQRLIALMEMLPVSVCLLAKDHTIRFANKRFRECFGDPEGRLCHDVFFGKGSPCGICPPMDVFEKETPKEYEMQKDDGTFYRFYNYPFTDIDGAKLVMELAVDITEIKKAEGQLREALEKAQQADTMKTRFIGNISHELRTPLNAINGLTTILMRKKDMPEEKKDEFLSIVQSCGSSLLNMIEQLLDLSRIDSGKMEPKFKPFDFHEMVGGLFERYKFQANVKALKFSFSVDDKVPGHLIGEPLMLERVLNNLIDNALKFTRQGEVSVKVALADRTEKGMVLRFEVNDTGIGIDKNEVGKIFSLFYQSDDSPTREFGGVGLGLAIARELVARMNGTITVDSVPGKGSTFVFTCEVFPDSKVQ